MKKEINKNSAYYTIAWSPAYFYDKYKAIKIVPQLPGIMCLYQKNNSKMEYFLFYNCWRDGLLSGLKKAMEPDVPMYKAIFNQIPKENIYYKYAEMDTNFEDFQDIIYWLIKTYSPRYNNPSFADSKRYENISVKEIERGENSIVEKIPKMRW